MHAPGRRSISCILRSIVLIAPFLPPANGVGDTPPLPYYLYCLVGIAIMAFGVLYWAAWRIVPRWFGYEYIPRKEKLSDGTTVTLVRSRSTLELGFRVRLAFSDPFLRSLVLYEKDPVRGHCSPTGRHDRDDREFASLIHTHFAPFGNL